MKLNNIVRAVAMLAALAGCQQQSATDPELESRRFALEDEVDGDFTVTSAVPTSVVQVTPSLCEITLDATFALDGDVDGSFDAIFDIYHLGSCAAPAFELFIAEGTFTGDVLDESGTFDLSFVGTIDPSRPTDETATGLLLSVEDSGTGGLADLEAAIVLTGEAGVGGSYSGEVEID